MPDVCFFYWSGMRQVGSVDVFFFLVSSFPFLKKGKRRQERPPPGPHARQTASFFTLMSGLWSAEEPSDGFYLDLATHCFFLLVPGVAKSMKRL